VLLAPERRWRDPSPPAARATGGAICRRLVTVAALGAVAGGSPRLAPIGCPADGVASAAGAPQAAGAPKEAPAMRAFGDLGLEERIRFAERMRAAPGAVGGGGAEDARRVVLVVSGGAPGERIEYRAEVTPAGRGIVRLLDEIRALREERRDLVIPSDRVRDLFQRAASDEVLGSEHPLPALVPDSLVGTLVVTDGQIEKRIRFPVESSVGETWVPGGADIVPAPAAPLRIRPEHAAPGVRSLAEALCGLPGLTR
jgi:hypothetical protein